MKFKDQTAVVTGGARGIGAAIAEAFAAEGADIAIVNYGMEEECAEVCHALTEKYSVKAAAYQCDVSDFEAVKTVCGEIKKDFGTVNILVNNAGITKDNLTPMMSEKDYDAVVDVDMKGVFNMIRHCYGFFIRNKSGAIINISSVSGIMGNPGQINYSAAKAGVIAITKTVARELAPRGVTVNAIAPGFIQTDMTKDIGSGGEELKKTIPVGHMGSPKDVAEAVVFLAGARYITGEVLRVDGGIAM